MWLLFQRGEERCDQTRKRKETERQYVIEKEEEREQTTGTAESVGENIEMIQQMTLRRTRLKRIK